jgi:hypothetical protein
MAAISTNIIHSDVFRQSAATMTNDMPTNIEIKSADANPAASLHFRKAWLIESKTSIRAPG